MKFFRLPSGDHQKNNKNSHQMGQFSSSEVQAASAVAGKAVLSTASAIGADNAGEMRAAAAVGAKQERAHSLAAAPFRPSQPIDILGKARHRSEVVQYGKVPMPMPPQREMQQHQPRVIQPRRLNAIPSASLGPMRGANGREELSGGNYRERIWQEAMRRRLLSLDSRPVDPECPSVSGDNNKENDEEQRMGGKQLSRSRKRLNSAELEYSGNGTETKMEQMELAKEGAEVQEEMPLRNSLDSGNPERGKQPKEGARKAAAGRIAYLYGVYGQQECAPYSQLLFPQKPQMMEENIFAGQRQPQMAKGGWVDCCWGNEGGRQSLQRQIHFGHQFCSDSEDECLELDGELEDEPVERLARLHSVSDIIGYAKVVRAQRQETLCRLDDVMSQFDALIRSYSMAIKGKTAVENEPEMKNAQPAPGLTAPIVQSKAITN